MQVTRTPLSKLAAERDVKLEVSSVIQAMNKWPEGKCRCGGRVFADQSAKNELAALDENLNIIDEYIYTLIGDGEEVMQHWVVTDWLAERLAQQGERIILMTANHYVWLRTGCGYAISEDLKFLDREDH